MAKQKIKIKTSFFSDFKAFISRGNVIDMAVGVIIANAFGKITTSLVNDVVMPLIGLLVGDIDLSKWNLTVRDAVLAADGITVEKEAVVVGIGTLLTVIIDFLLVALVVFIIIRAIGRAKARLAKKEEEKAAEPAPEPAPTKEELLLTEIRDLLKQQK